ncbi:MAG: hypothetical protein QXI84_05140 [Thermofilaceae archaeon]
MNGKPVPVSNGYFATYAFPGRDGEIAVRVRKGGLEKVIVRRFSIKE